MHLPSELLPKTYNSSLVVRKAEFEWPANIDEAI
jgi:hypothetical protein